MKTFHASITAFILVLALCGAARAADAGNASSDAAGASNLLARVEAHYRAQGDKALAAFSRGGEFREGDLYVYALNTDGVMLASGGSSAVLVGRNVGELIDASGRPFIREIL
ncbi:hypothetical protein [Azoarcus sp. DN11]|uniref:hypothetical protein n=1 Tax=Azoarcus sp. DN11 TaxID=356837 RepID=UPI000EB351E0|nr:hypothetical protein [Azoarcus sp. DN11]AYH43528.1 hypothetical protein CDA09_09055 [Azoarcus sp. DN11]